MARLKCWFRWIKAHPWRTTAVALLLFLVLPTLLACFHAYALTHFDPEGGSSAERVKAATGWHKVKMVLFGVRLQRPRVRATPEQFQLPFEVQRIAGEGETELESWYVPRTDAKGVVLLFHGFGGCRDSLLTEAAVFHDLGYSALLVDFRGCGGSSGNVTTLGYYEANDVAAAVAHARARWPGRVVLFGQSMGAAAVLRAVGRLGVEADAVVVECPFDRLSTAVASRFTNRGLPSVPGTQLLVLWGGLQQGFNGFCHNPADYARGVACPVLHLHGGRDQHIPREQADAVFDGFAGDKQFVLFPDAPHAAYVARHRERWTECVGQFLARHLAPAE